MDFIYFFFLNLLQIMLRVVLIDYWQLLYSEKASFNLALQIL